MAYDFVKLNEVTLVDSASNPNMLIEDGGEIKRISVDNITTPQSQSDWNETDINSPAFILNKPENVGKNNIITYTIASNMLMHNGVAASAQSIVDAWNNGSILRIVGNTIIFNGAPYHPEGNVIGVYYALASGVVVNNSCSISYYLSSSIKTMIVQG